MPRAGGEDALGRGAYGLDGRVRHQVEAAESGGGGDPDQHRGGAAYVQRTVRRGNRAAFGLDRQDRRERHAVAGRIRVSNGVGDVAVIGFAQRRGLADQRDPVAAGVCGGCRGRAQLAGQFEAAIDLAASIRAQAQDDHLVRVRDEQVAPEVRPATAIADRCDRAIEVERPSIRLRGVGVIHLEFEIRHRRVAGAERSLERLAEPVGTHRVACEDGLTDCRQRFAAVVIGLGGGLSAPQRVVIERQHVARDPAAHHRA